MQYLVRLSLERENTRMAEKSPSKWPIPKAKIYYNTKSCIAPQKSSSVLTQKRFTSRAFNTNPPPPTMWGYLNLIFIMAI
jgi:hypothetical protein